MARSDDVVTHLENLIVSAFIAPRIILADNLKFLEQCMGEDILLGVVNLQPGHDCEIYENTTIDEHDSMIEKAARGMKMTTLV